MGVTLGMASIIRFAEARDGEDLLTMVTVPPSRLLADRRADNHGD
jgi:hypothetical protein